MVIEDAFFPQCPGGYFKQGGYGGGYGHGTAGYNFSDQSCYGTNTSTMKMARPNINTPSEPAKHFVVDTENPGHGHSHGHGHDKSHGFSHQHHSAGGDTHHQQHGVDRMFGTGSHLMGGYTSGFGYPSNNKPAFPFVGGGGGATYEYERESYHGDGGVNRCQTMGMPFYGMQAPPPPHAAGYHHWAAGKGDAAGECFTNSKGI